jgi:hypothetical protein
MDLDIENGFVRGDSIHLIFDIRFFFFHVYFSSFSYTFYQLDMNTIIALATQVKNAFDTQDVDTFFESFTAFEVDDLASEIVQELSQVL